MRNFRKRLALLLVTVVAFSAFSGFSVFADSLGDKLYGDSLVIGEEARLAKGVYWNSGYTEKIAENYIEYTPGASVLPIISHGNDVYGAASFKSVVARAAMDGKYVVAGFNGDFFNMANGVPTGLTIKENLLITSESMRNPSVGFKADGEVIIGRPNLNVRVDSPALGSGIGSIHVNKVVTKASGLMLYTRDYADDDTNKASIPTYNVVLSVDREEISLNGSIEAVVETVSNAMGATFIPEGRFLLTMASGTDYPGTLAKLTTLIPGEKITLSFAADPAWDDVVYGVGGGDKLVSQGKNVAPKNAEIHPRTAIGIRADGRAIFYTVDGRQAGHSKGTTLSQLANRLIELGCVEGLNMDGGGSTAIHAVYPGENKLDTINKPSQTTLRNCANYILLINNASPSGRLGNLHLYPYSVRMLAGARQKFDIKATDTNFYPLDPPSNILFSSPKGLGNFDGEDIFTAGSTGGVGQIKATSRGGESGTAEITIVEKPDTISIFNQKDGKAVSTIALNAGETIDLSASAVSNRLPLVSQAHCYNWTVEGGIGTIDENGRFTAGNISSGTGTIKASLAGVSASVKVNVTSEGWRLETFEGSDHAFQGPMPQGLILDINTDLTKVRYGYQSAKLKYDLSKQNKGDLLVASSMTFSKSPSIISFWVYGDRSGNLLNLLVNTSTETKELKGSKLDFSGWKQVVVNLPVGAKSLKALKILGEGADKGEIYLDQFVAGQGYYVDQEPPVLEMSIDGQSLLATIKDDIDKRISASKIKLTYDGSPLEFKYDQDTKTLTAGLPADGGQMHRLTLIASDESGNLQRKGLSIGKTDKQTQPFLDMNGHWAMENTLYLNKRGVVNGVVTDQGLIYNPDRSITRAEFAVLMKNWIGDKDKSYSGVNLPFIDVDSIPPWALDAVKSMYGMGIIMGTGTDKGVVFNAQGPISRQEVMTIIGRTQERGFPESNLSAFADSSQLADWALPYVKPLVKQGVVSGYSGKIWPKDPVTRAEVATIITLLY